MENRNLGILIAPPRSTDYILGVSSPLTISRSVKDWSIYLPEVETQRDSITDFLDCVTFSMIHSIEVQLNYLMFTNQLPDEALNFFHNNNYIVDGLFALSARFSAKMNGTDKTMGQYQNVAADSVRVIGCVPKLLWDMTPNMTFADYYATPPENLLALAKKFLSYVNIQYQWVNFQNFPTVLPVSPIQAATEVCAGWDSAAVVEMCTGQPIQHCTLIYGQSGFGDWLDFDQYPPYKQILASNYEFPSNMQYIVTPNLNLKVGMSGTNVLQLQKNLNELGFIVAEDSNFGVKTQTAVISLQNKTGLKPDGVVGPLTQAEIQKLLNSPSIKEIVTQTATAQGVEPQLALAVAQCEGGLTNAKITRTNTNGSVDRGIFQINNKVFPSVTDDQAFDVTWATNWFCTAVKTGHLHYWYLSQPNWSKLVSSEILAKYKIIK